MPSIGNRWSRWGWLRSGWERSLASEWATSMRKPSTPRSAQNRRVWMKSCSDVGIGPVEVRLFAGEEVADTTGRRAVVPRRCRRSGSASRRAVPDRPVRCRRGRCTGRAPAEPGRCGQGLLEPGVLVGGVVGDDVDDDLDAAGVGIVGEVVEVGQGAEPGVDAAVVADVVAAVGERGGVERRQPDGVDPEVGQVAQPAADTGEVADAVAVGVGEAAWVDLVDNGRAPPVRVDRFVAGVHVRNSWLGRRSRG